MSRREFWHLRGGVLHRNVKSWSIGDSARIGGLNGTARALYSLMLAAHIARKDDGTISTAAPQVCARVGPISFL